MTTTLETLLQSLPSREDLANAIGYESRSSNSTEVLSAISLFGTGMLFGAGLALLFAPKSGSEMRRDLSEGMQQYGYGEKPEKHEYSGARSGERQMSSQSGIESSRYSSEQEYPHQMSGQTTTQRQKS